MSTSVPQLVIEDHRKEVQQVEQGRRKKRARSQAQEWQVEHWGRPVVHYSVSMRGNSQTHPGALVDLNVYKIDQLLAAYELQWLGFFQMTTKRNLTSKFLQSMAYIFAPFSCGFGQFCLTWPGGSAVVKHDSP